MGCVKCFSIFLSTLVLIKGLTGLVLGILAIIPFPFATVLLLTIALGFGAGVVSIGSEAADLIGVVAIAYLYYIIIAVGVLGLFVGIWGIVAAAKKNRCMLITGSVLLFLLLAVEAVITVFTGLGYSTITKRYTTENFAILKSNDVFLKFQTENKCCGITGPGDWAPDAIPKECCIKDTTDMIDLAKCQAKEAGFVFTEGCGQFSGTIIAAAWVPIGVMIAVSCITLFSFILITALCCNLRKDEYA